ncbi:MAG: hypothetical protein ACP5QS_00140 [bacterium]
MNASSRSGFADALIQGEATLDLALITTPIVQLALLVSGDGIGR